MDRPRDWLSARAAVVLPVLVAVLSFVTGVVNISAVSISGPLGEFVPRSIQRTAGFTGALTGFTLLVSVVGLRRRLRIAWYVTLVLLPIAAVQAPRVGRKGMEHIADHLLEVKDETDL